MHQGADLELGLAEELTVGLADEQAGEGEQLVVGALPDAGEQFLGLGFEFGGEGVVKGHGVLRVRRWVFLRSPIFACREQKLHQLSSCSHRTPAKWGKRLLPPPAWGMLTLPAGSPAFPPARPPDPPTTCNA